MPNCLPHRCPFGYALQSGKNSDLHDLQEALFKTANQCKRCVIQWVPSHCDIHGNEEADKLAKEGAKLPQNNTCATYEETKTLIKKKYRKKWEKEHPGHNNEDAYHKLGREEQVLIFRLRTGHNRLRHHLFNKMKIGTTDLCNCGTAAMTAEHLMQECPTFEEQRKLVWSTPVSYRHRLYGSNDG